MTGNEFQKKALRTAAVYDKEELITNGIMGLGGEVGEVVDILKKYIYQGNPINRDKLLEECGDVCWYVAITAHALDIKMDNLAPWGEINQIKSRKYTEISKEMLKGIGLLVLDIQRGAGNYILEVILTKVLYGVKEIAEKQDSTLAEVYQINVDKLLKRYPNGFSSDRSINRSEG